MLLSVGCFEGLLDPHHAGRARAGAPRRLADVGASGEQGLDRHDLGAHHRRPPEPGALGLRSGEPGQDPVPDHRALELREDADHAEDHTTGKRGRIERLGVRVQADAAGLQLAEQRNEVLEGAAEATDRPHCDEVELAAGDAAHQLVEGGAAIASFGAGDALVCVDVDDGPARRWATSFD